MQPRKPYLFKMESIKMMSWRTSLDDMCVYVHVMNVYVCQAPYLRFEICSSFLPLRFDTVDGWLESTCTCSFWELFSYLTWMHKWSCFMFIPACTRKMPETVRDTRSSMSHERHRIPDWLKTLRSHGNDSLSQGSSCSLEITGWCWGLFANSTDQQIEGSSMQCHAIFEDTFAKSWYLTVSPFLVPRDPNWSWRRSSPSLTMTCARRSVKVGI